ncbi:MAG: hypothetical protein JXA33_15545 [Anaerolineae bacterium]|nr:hypothetical protein [Anaerolineae bacterium]
MKRFSVVLFLVLVMTLLVAIPTMAAEGGHIYGVVFVDSNGDSVWKGESGVADVAIHFSANPNPDRGAFKTLRSAWTDNLSSALSGSTSDFPADMQCSHFTDDHIGVPQGCNGTFGLYPVTTGSWWYVWIDVPAGYTYGRADGLGTKSNPFVVKALSSGEAGVVQFPLQVSVATTVQPASTPAGRQVFIARPSAPKTTVGAYPVKAFVY